MNNSHWKIKRTIVVAFICLLMLILPVQADTIHVSEHVVGGTGLGNNWQNANPSLADTLQAAQPGDTILVGQGTYHPDLNQSFTILDKMIVVGGYAGWLPTGVLAADPDLRNVQNFRSILSGDLEEDDDPFIFDRDYLTSLSRSENSHTVVMVLNVTQDTRIEGFFIEGGNRGTYSGNDASGYRGGGMLIDDSQMDVVNCTFRFNAVGIPGSDSPGENGVTSDGGGASVRGGKKVANITRYTRFINCTFHDNFAARGGGLSLVDGSPTDVTTQVKVVNSLFYNNQALVISEADLFVADDSDAAIVLRKSIFQSELAFKSQLNSGTGILPLQ